ncbi:MAG: hypothetical protein ABI220_01480 [Candidatus Saccharimonadales bacterium]
MNDAFNILVVTLSCLLGVFLILSIVLCVMSIKVVNAVKRIVAKGELVVDSAEAAAEIFKKAAGPMGVLRAITNIVEAVIKRKGGKS